MGWAAQVQDVVGICWDRLVYKLSRPILRSCTPGSMSCLLLRIIYYNILFNIHRGTI